MLVKAHGTQLQNPRPFLKDPVEPQVLAAHDGGTTVVAGYGGRHLVLCAETQRQLGERHAQPVMIVVPDSPGVSAEVAIANLDIGFVNAGQVATVKLETFPYTRYGTVAAQVSMVSADAVTEEKKGSYYPAILTLSQKDMAIDGKRIPLNPGMNLTAEIKTGHRRVIDYLLSPVQRAGSESLRER